MNTNKRKTVITLIFVVILIVIVLALTAFLPYKVSRNGIPPVLPGTVSAH